MKRSNANRMRFSGPAGTAILTILCALFTALLCLRLLDRYDNKYTAKIELAQDGAAILPENGVRFLVDGWELYPDRLLGPDDFSAGDMPSRYRTWSGEYPNLAPFHSDGNPYGAATYRLRLRGDGVVSLYLQEPLCCARLFVDGRDMGGPGQVAEHPVTAETGRAADDTAAAATDRGAATGYRPLIRDTVYSFPVDGEAWLILQTANFSHYYGGLWYPPAIGTADSVSRYVASRMIFYGLLFFSSLALSLFCIVLWLGKRRQRDPTAFYFGLLCLSFSVRVCYPFLRLWGVPLVRSLYALEDVAALAGLYFAVRISLLLFLPESMQKGELLRHAASTLSLGMCGAAAVIPLFILPVFPSFALWYGPLISWYKVLCAVFLTGAAFCGCLAGRAHIRPALAAVTANGVCLLFGILSIGSFEPILGGWPEEYGAFFMVFAFAGLMVRRSREMAAQNLRLTDRLEEEVDEKTRHLSLLLAERGQLMEELGHDMKSPLTALSNMAQIIRMNKILLDENTQERMKSIEDQCALLSDRLHSIQRLTKETGIPARLEPLSLNRFLSDFFRSNRPVVELTGPDLLLKLTPMTCTVMADREKLSRALENLVFNAADFTPPEGNILLSLDRDGSFARIRVADTGCGIPESELPKIFCRLYTTRAAEGGQGLGLTITREIILEHGGEISVESAEGQGTVFTVRLPLSQ